LGKQLGRIRGLQLVKKFKTLLAKLAGTTNNKLELSKICKDYIIK